MKKIKAKATDKDSSKKQVGKRTDYREATVKS